MERLIDHTFFEKLENERKFDNSTFQDLLETIKNTPRPTNQESFKRLVVNLVECQRAIYLSLLFHFEPDDLFKFKELPISAEEIISQFDEVMDEVLKKHFGK